VVSACGGTSSSAISGKTPAQLLAQAFSKATSQKFSFSSTTTLTADLSKVTGFSPSQLGAFGPALANGVSISFDGTYESPTRTLFHIKLQPFCSGDIYVADYDGQGYISSDGKTWASTGASSSSPSSSSFNQTQATTSLNGVGFKDNGSTSQDGQTVEDLRLDFNNQLIQKLATAAGQPALAAGYGQYVTVDGDGVDIYVSPSSGQLESVKGTLKVTLDVTTLVGLASLSGGATSSLGDLSSAGGKLGLSLNENAKFTNWGSATVSKPSASGSSTSDQVVASACPQLAGLAGSLGGLTGGGNGGVPTPDLSGGNVTNSFSDISNSLSAN
jgi:hypothetical protein